MDAQDYSGQFLSILNNKGKAEGRGPRRNRGFLVLVRPAQSLQVLQDLCFSSEQVWNKCLTARYRHGPGRRFGTLFAAFLSDMRKLGSDMRHAYGDLQPPPEDERWLDRLKGGFLDVVWPATEQLEEPSGKLGSDLLSLVLKALSSEPVLSTGNRLVLFSEGTELATDIEEWEQAIEELAPHLPERVGLVLSGAPPGLALPSDDPHFLELEIPDVADVSARARAVQALNYALSPLQSDRPADVDQLGVEHYASAIADFVMHPGTQPLTIGIHGQWGKGKSSFMGFVERALVVQAPANRGDPASRLADLDQKVHEVERTREDSNANFVRGGYEARLREARRARAKHWRGMVKNADDDVITVAFNAWRYQDAKQIWAGLARIITDRLELRLKWRRFTLPVEYAWARHRRKLVFEVAAPLLLAGLLGAALIGHGSELPPADEATLQQTLAEEAKVSGLDQMVRLMLPAGAGGSLLLVALVVWRLYTLLQPVSQQIGNYARRPSYREQTGFQHQVLDDIGFVYSRIRKRSPQHRVIIFIDDLDRCSDDKVMELLQAIHLILGASNFYVFLGIDTDMIHRAIDAYYRKNQSGAALPEDFARLYLRKIIQLSFHLPPSSMEERATLIESLFSSGANKNLRKHMGSESSQQASTEVLGAAPEGVDYDLSTLRDPVVQTIKDVEDSEDELAAFLDYSEYLADNPREIKRLTNVHRLVKILLQRFGVVWTAEKQRKLVKWLVFCTRWPRLVGTLFEHAKFKPAAPNCLLSLCDTLQQQDREPAELRRFAGGEDSDSLSSAELLEDQHLHLSAEFTQMISANLEVAVELQATEPRQDGEHPVPSAGSAVHANRRSRIYHELGCPGYHLVRETDREIFESPDAAESAGYRRAKNCPPRSG